MHISAILQRLWRATHPPSDLGAVLSHVMPDGSERPVMFTSRSLSKSKRTYAQIDKEALGIVWSKNRGKRLMIGYQRKFTCKQVIIEFAHAPDNTEGLFVYLCIISLGFADQCDAAFENIKKLVTSDQVLTHYDPALSIRLACDASPFGLGSSLIPRDARRFGATSYVCFSFSLITGKVSKCDIWKISSASKLSESLQL
jgi:hypothetical protein